MNCASKLFSFIINLSVSPKASLIEPAVAEVTRGKAKRVTLYQSKGAKFSNCFSLLEFGLPVSCFHVLLGKCLLVCHLSLERIFFAWIEVKLRKETLGKKRTLTKNENPREYEHGYMLTGVNARLNPLGKQNRE